MSLQGISVKKGAPSDMVQCPYVPSHSIERSRMQFHIVKCRKAFPNVKLLTCPFNATHRVYEPELNFHVTTCQSRLAFDEMKYAIESPDGPVDLAPIPVLPPTEENWEDCDTPSYNPKEHLEDTKIISILRGAQPAERRAHRMEQRRKFASAGTGPTQQ